MARGAEFALAKYIATLDATYEFVQDIIDAGNIPRDAVAAGNFLVTAGQEPVQPENAIMVFRAPGGRFANEIQEEVFLEVRVRAKRYDDAASESISIGNSLHNAQGLLGGLAMRVRANAPSTPLTGVEDEQKLWQHSQVFTVLLKQGENFVV